MLKRDEYIKKIVPFIDKDVIKVLTGIRRSGKSVMLKLLMEELKKRKINENKILVLEFVLYKTDIEEIIGDTDD